MYITSAALHLGHESGKPGRRSSHSFFLYASFRLPRAGVAYVGYSITHAAFLSWESSGFSSKLLSLSADPPALERETKGL
jgi:hypothetical protein